MTVPSTPSSPVSPTTTAGSSANESTPSFFVDESHDHGTHGCDYLLTVDMEMEPVPGYRYANWELGYGDFHMVPDLSTLRLATWLESTALVLCDLHEPKSHELVAVGPRSILRRQLARRRRIRVTRPRGPPNSSTSSSRTRYRQAADKQHVGMRPGRLVHRGLPPPAGHPRGVLQSPGPAAPGRLGDTGRELQRRMGSRSTRDERTLHRGAHHGRSPRRDETGHEGDRRRTRRERHLHGQARRCRSRLELPHPPFLVGRRRRPPSPARWPLGPVQGPTPSAGSWADGWPTYRS